MSINPIIIRQNFKIGELDAESDTLLLENCFIDSGYLSKLLNPSDTSSIVIGRTGAGKSALLHMVLPGDLQSCRHQHTAVKTGHNAGILAVHPTVRFSWKLSKSSR